MKKLFLLLVLLSSTISFSQDKAYNLTVIEHLGVDVYNLLYEAKIYVGENVAIIDSDLFDSGSLNFIFSCVKQDGDKKVYNGYISKGDFNNYHFHMSITSTLVYVKVNGHVFAYGIKKDQ
ncbi:hypothetical protein Phi19:3_gp066 [Cellulophaga phage phi19:3]|uniref:Uncharacterized protein n=1 Tax=Cellulophaga phage phi19:3 TaxID=1327971 RepID=R9ZY77_9CAUD|nr:hypothetical protein Phi19:3_gp066 [Cellulophaga phage phi19:3]AGO47470.1 hypothetical protein Phi19:3_gp066 [Cellulophaga phage phi19:3]